MMIISLRRIAAAWTMSFALMAAASAQTGTGRYASGLGDRQADLALRLLPSFNLSRGDIRHSGIPQREGLIAAVRLNEDLHVGLGRFRIVEPARPRTHVESERAPTDVRRRERGVAAVGMSLRF